MLVLELKEGRPFIICTFKLNTFALDYSNLLLVSHLLSSMFVFTVLISQMVGGDRERKGKIQGSIVQKQGA